MNEEERFKRNVEFDVIRNAFLCTDRVIERLKHLPGPDKGCPMEVFREMKAIAQIEIWENSGLSAVLPKDLPSSKEAFARMIKRMRTNPEAYLNGTPGTDFAEQVSSVHTAIYIEKELTSYNPSFMTTTMYSREQLKLIADCLWDLRHLAVQKRGKHDVQSQEIPKSIPAKKQRKTGKLPGITNPVGQTGGKKP